MAFSITELANYSEGNGAGGNVISKTTGTLSIPANSLVLVFGQGTSAANDWGSATMSVSDSVDGTTGWTGLDSQQVTSTTPVHGGRVFSKSFAGSTSRTITIGRDTGTVYWGYSVVVITGHNTASPIVQAKGSASPYWNDTGDSHSWSVTLGSNPVSGNAVIAFLGVNNDANGAATAPSGFTTLDIPAGQFENASVAYNTSTTAATIDWSDCGQAVEGAIAFAVEVAQLGPPTVSTSAVTSVTPTTAQGNGSVDSDGGDTITERGFVWSTSPNPTTSGSKVTASGTTGSYNASLTGLSAYTVYHVRAYATNGQGTSYGADVTFKCDTATAAWLTA